MNKLELLTYVFESLRMAQHAHNKIPKDLYIAPESVVFSSERVLWDGLICIAKTATNDKYGWIEWFVYDNDLGSKAMEAGPVGNTRPIVTAKDLLEIIE